MSTTETLTPTTTETAVEAGARVRPPVLFASTLLVGFLLHRMLPFSLLPRGFAQIAGRILAVAGLALGVSAVRTMRAAGTSPDPHNPTQTVVTEGPYRFTRNPIYLGMTLLYSGISLFFNAVWPLLLLPAVLFAVKTGMIKPEEEYLERRFGAQYREYKQRVRRWM